MYKTEDELDAEIEQLRQTINQQEQPSENVIASEETEQEISENEKLAITIRAMFEDDKSNDDIISSIEEALSTSKRIFKAKLDADALLSAEDDVKQTYPEFDIVCELKSNHVFRRLIANGITLHTALLASNRVYEDLITSKIKTEAKREFANALRKGRERILPITTEGCSIPKTDVNSMSDEQFEEIEKKVKQNKRIYL